MPNQLILNAGSNSLKFDLIADGGGNTFGTSVLSGSYDDIGKENPVRSILKAKRPDLRESTVAQDHGQATTSLLRWIASGQAADYGVGGLSDIRLVGHRIVHGADRFTEPARISADLVSQIDALKSLAPLHNEPALQCIRASQAAVDPALPMFAVFDTAFHHSIPDEAARYPLPLELAERHGIRRYGFHGISHRYLMLRYAELTGRSPESVKLVTLHLEGGSSATAIQHGKSVDTSMGFTPLEGLMMGTRCGDIDPAIVTHLMRKENWSIADVDDFLNKHCGLLGVSGLSADTRELRVHTASPQVTLALDMYCYRVRKYIGAYLAVMGGADAIIFGGGIGENTSFVRERICQGLAWCGATLDLQKNRDSVDVESLLSAPDSPIQIWVIPTQEALMMAREIAAVER